jgi:hypothetical protein
MVSRQELIARDEEIRSLNSIIKKLNEEKEESRHKLKKMLLEALNTIDEQKNIISELMKENIKLKENKKNN